jgi:hypothetical protein
MKVIGTLGSKPVARKSEPSLVIETALSPHDTLIMMVGNLVVSIT